MKAKLPRENNNAVQRTESDVNTKHRKN